MNKDSNIFLLDQKSYSLLLEKAKEKVYKTFDDLEFKPHFMGVELDGLDPNIFSESFIKLSDKMRDAKHAIISFDNGYGISICIGDPSLFLSNGVDTYEVAVLKNGYLCKDSPITNEVMGELSKDVITEIMKNVQDLPSCQQ